MLYPMTPIRVLFVCTGNICRSPTAEAVFEKLIKTNHLEERIHVDSAGLESYHAGDAPDLRSQRHALARGYDLSTQRARQIQSNDFREFDHILALDESHLHALLEMAPKVFRSKIRLFLEGGVPDPYYGEGPDFERVLDLSEEGAQNLFNHIRNSLK